MHKLTHVLYKENNYRIDTIDRDNFRMHGVINERTKLQRWSTVKKYERILWIFIVADIQNVSETVETSFLISAVFYARPNIHIPPCSLESEACRSVR